MSMAAAQDQGLDKVVDQLCTMDGVECEKLVDGRVGLELSYNGASAEVFINVSASDYRIQKIQFSHLRKSLTELGVREGQTYAAPKLPRRPMTPQMRAAREQKKQEFESWQEMWRVIRKAEKALDVAYEIIQMRDYY